MARLSHERREFMIARIRSCPEFNYMRGNDNGGTRYVFNHRIIDELWRAYAYALEIELGIQED